MYHHRHVQRVNGLITDQVDNEMGSHINQSFISSAARTRAASFFIDYRVFVIDRKVCSDGLHRLSGHRVPASFLSTCIAGCHRYLWPCQGYPCRSTLVRWLVPVSSNVDLDESSCVGTGLCRGVSAVGMESVRDQYVLHVDWGCTVGDQFPIKTNPIFLFAAAKDLWIGFDSGKTTLLRCHLTTTHRLTPHCIDLDVHGQLQPIGVCLLTYCVAFNDNITLQGAPLAIFIGIVFGTVLTGR